KDYEAAAIANSVGTRMIARGVVNEGDYEIIYTSETFPTTAYGLAHNLTPELAQSIQDAFFSYDWEGTALEAEFANSGESQFIPISYEENWSVIRTIADATGVTYDCD
ncbi:MAG: PhnD/SsuA/transferrin family substrate-binding protein, partial [Gammaproteobacteria bacterium]|nr:PhnD/SsuA/transferrin family substrate-binding protein [Gammaproteobacteria bacterium]